MRILYLFLFFVSFLNASFEEGKEIFKNKCSSCHKDYIPFNLIKENFYEKSNKLLNLKAPTANMIAWAMFESSKKIGDENEEDFREIEIASFLKSYLENPDRFNTICDDTALDFYDNKKSMKGELTDDEYEKLAIYFIEYKDNIQEEIVLKASKYSQDDEKNIIKEAKNSNKKIIVYATSSTCYFCKKMDREVFSKDSIKNIIKENYIFLEIDMDINSLPFSLQKEYKKITPSFFFLNNNEELITQYPGAWVEEDFLKILNEHR